ncbi:MAG: hypothetical protein LAT62_14880 [Natronospirillum sp.]|uniref:hypothetical protein n=1 Tax=Natronospirillum sp. TaxID=2812955 RepID=UPI0025D08C31|nr:hypothetical protein [Natronospirillum sp.]MCH8553220.1 hypothetical protein [Natronospirillum sp.]
MAQVILTRKITAVVEETAVYEIPDDLVDKLDADSLSEDEILERTLSAREFHASESSMDVQQVMEEHSREITIER